MSTESSNEPVFCYVTCNTCHELIHTEARKVSRKVVCHECGRPVRVPALDELSQRQVKSVASNIKDVGEYELGEVKPLPADLHQPSPYITARSEFRQELASPKPQWTFFSGIFLFPFQGDVLGRWLYLSFGMFMTLLVAIIALTVGFNLGTLQASPQGGMLAFFILPEIWISLWTFSFAAACGLSILESTAAGLDRVDHWPGPLWQEWAAELFFIMWLLILALTLGYFVTLPGRLLWPESSSVLWIGSATFLLFPILLLSAMEARHAWLPLSAHTWSTLVTKAWAWLLFYLLSGAAWGAVLVPTWYGLRYAPFVMVLVMSPLIAANLFIQCRLMGRLAWKIAQ